MNLPIGVSYGVAFAVVAFACKGTMRRIDIDVLEYSEGSPSCKRRVWGARYQISGNASLNPKCPLLKQWTAPTRRHPGANIVDFMNNGEIGAVHCFRSRHTGVTFSLFNRGLNNRARKFPSRSDDEKERRPGSGIQHMIQNSAAVHPANHNHFNQDPYLNCRYIFELNRAVALA